MLKITNWKDLPTLPITPTLLTQLKQHLLAPFHDENEAQNTWTELECELWMISSLSDVSRVGVDGNRITKREKNLLNFALENIEFEDELDYGSLLTLSILSDSGQGLYLLMPQALKSDLMNTLGVNHE
ncbi:hypothetical protein [Moritella viscosa]|uniref:Uncharacterized protein n=1 Tax=Moritella viscosa TaxID=80854 RepID=A0ABY1H9R9_9GAMM|nr:hypothetical protein [Moritella viscosa]SGY81370.1 Putative uncharacterized protein [Moritella viscosa]SGY81526.1 Putative uncharacterized protein [Moritella viscosa]SHO23996.1 Putative uncharacterized protein [Moritella viscosa]